MLNLVCYRKNYCLEVGVLGAELIKPCISALGAVPVLDVTFLEAGCCLCSYVLYLMRYGSDKAEASDVVLAFCISEVAITACAVPVLKVTLLEAGCFYCCGVNEFMSMNKLLVAYVAVAVKRKLIDTIRGYCSTCIAKVVIVIVIACGNIESANKTVVRLICYNVYAFVRSALVAIVVKVCVETSRYNCSTDFTKMIAIERKISTIANLLSAVFTVVIAVSEGICVLADLSSTTGLVTYVVLVCVYMTCYYRCGNNRGGGDVGKVACRHLYVCKSKYCSSCSGCSYLKIDCQKHAVSSYRISRCTVYKSVCGIVLKCGGCACSYLMADVFKALGNRKQEREAEVSGVVCNRYCNYNSIACANICFRCCYIHCSTVCSRSCKRYYGDKKHRCKNSTNNLLHTFVSFLYCFDYLDAGNSFSSPASYLSTQIASTYPMYPSLSTSATPAINLGSTKPTS